MINPSSIVPWIITYIVLKTMSVVFGFDLPIDFALPTEVL